MHFSAGRRDFSGAGKNAVGALDQILSESRDLGCLRFAFCIGSKIKQTGKNLLIIKKKVMELRIKTPVPYRAAPRVTSELFQLKRQSVKSLFGTRNWARGTLFILTCGWHCVDWDLVVQMCHPMTPHIQAEGVNWDVVNGIVLGNRWEDLDLSQVSRRQNFYLWHLHLNDTANTSHFPPIANYCKFN